jgi:hypothetical protein
VSLRLLAVIAEISLGTVVVAWGIAAAYRPSCWTCWGARWWVGWTGAPVSRTHGAALALVGLGLLGSAVATALTAPAMPIPVLARDLQLIGLGVVLVGGVLLAATHPAPEDPTPGDAAPEDPAPADSATPPGHRQRDAEPATGTPLAPAP